MTVRSSTSGQRLPEFIRSLAAAVKGDARSGSIGDGTPSASGSMKMIGELEISAVAAAANKKYDNAIAFMKMAASMEDQMGPPSGPPGIVKPSHELYGEILLRAGKPKEAREQFQTALLRQPNRARSLLGVARAAAQSGDAQTASATYAKLLEQWQLADTGLAELREAQDYLKQAKR